jgi:hypothetical protein
MTQITMTYQACEIIEGFDGEDHDIEEVAAAYQYLIDSGAVWLLQGAYVRGALQMMDLGYCHPAAASFV